MTLPWQEIFLTPLDTLLGSFAHFTTVTLFPIVQLQLCARGFAARIAELGHEPLRACRVEAMFSTKMQF